jgi:hypothetical protein
MSSTLAPSTLSPNNPITPSSVTDTLAKLGLAAPEKDVADYTSLLTGIWEIWNKVDGMDDYVPTVDTERFPREGVHFPEGDENKANAWAWKASVKDVSGKAKGGVLDGKTVCLKVSRWSCATWVGLDWLGLDSLELTWIGLEVWRCGGLDWLGLAVIGSVWTGFSPSPSWALWHLGRVRSESDACEGGEMPMKPADEPGQRRAQGSSVSPRHKRHQGLDAQHRRDGRYAYPRGWRGNHGQGGV